jgi:hypothetical protein
MRPLVLLLVLGCALACTKSERRPDTSPGPGLSLAEYARTQKRVADEEASYRTNGLAAAKVQMDAATTVSEYRVIGPFWGAYAAHPNWKELPKYDGFPVLAKRVVSRAIGSQLAAALATPESYLQAGKESNCLPDPRYVVAFEGANRRVDVVIGFTCGSHVWMKGVPELEHVTFALSASGQRALDAAQLTSF